MLVHPNIAQVYDFGRIGGIYYIAMELVAGFDLRKLLRYANRANEPIPLPVVLSILGELCDALEYAHDFIDEQGTRLNIVHRDISPSNMIVAHTGHIKVIDFGIAKASSRQLHTESGQVKGKLGYMSPEAALGMSSGGGIRRVLDGRRRMGAGHRLAAVLGAHRLRDDAEDPRGRGRAAVASQPGLPSRARSPDPRRARARPGASAAVGRRVPPGPRSDRARYGIHVSARSVAEWIQQFMQPDDHAAHPRGRTPPPEVRDPAAVGGSGCSARTTRSRSRPRSGARTRRRIAPPGPDFSVADGGPVPTLSGLALGAADVRFSPNTAPGVADLQLTAPPSRRRRHAPAARLSECATASAAARRDPPERPSAVPYGYRRRHRRKATCRPTPSRARRKASSRSRCSRS